MRRKKYKTSRLFPRPNFFTGLGSILNIAGTYYEFRHSSGNPDSEAINSDWGVVGDDFRNSMKKVDTKGLLTKY